MNTQTSSQIVVAGATGNLGYRIAAALKDQGAAVVALVRHGAGQSRVTALEGRGVQVRRVEFDDAERLRDAIMGADCVVCALNGLEEVMLGQQGKLLRAAVSAGVPRFIPSDFSLDYTKTRPGDNRNLDLRRRFRDQLDATPISATSVLCGGFLELLEGSARLVVPGRRVLHFGDANQKLDFTAKDDVASYTAAAALDPQSPRDLRIAGNSISPYDIARLLNELTGERYRMLRPGGLGTMSAIIRVVRALTPTSDDPFPPWQGMQYLRDMMSGRGKLFPLDNDRYGARAWQSARQTLAHTYAPEA
ncbi:NmrA family NAD(P)-binding protein [Xanthomonas phaseoli]|uniref:NmrA family protein n=1 Tax=Xanthomonas phaseoli pv. dieffenbachiae TaxID=92828 RepID=A0A1V9GWV0_9XANT|nr:NmrA family NAD(P)-binding protein [Xanthomonas phaseoli]MBO9788674.1 NmrA family NAD(P)-binding protein [Xanthomonas phaseoli pv. dieffenbachiae]MBO9831075.1 NmrA family NAD(P)-binding protein [Xanthomonas phaseoli pv. dieffenbachiae]MBO9837410.1 NmrA family NAD(P)-binding protein [Xanthomonas phaseoli pv. dieffenbachiae]MBO9839350.1 NmrA family NAD(P)-binding protein [Xanthomonas phaseoli pv. dieffenbachiae]MBO9854297.1 NmrA family NAD(P)-binding protein [Xanthomonas phaseoli pv. dieffenb